MIRSLLVVVNGRLRQLLPENSLRARFARGTFWSLVGTVIAQGLAMIASIVTARLLGKVSFGELGMINSTVGTFGTFAGLGLGLTATKYVAEYRHKDVERAGRILGLSTQVAVISGGVVSLALLALAPWLAAHTLNAPHLVYGLRLGALSLFLHALIGLQTGALAGLEAFKTITQVTFWRGLLRFPVLIAGVWFFGLMGAVGATVVADAAGWWLGERALRKECARAGISSTIRGVRSELPMLWSFALPAFLSGVVVGPALWLGNTLLVNQPGGYGELGLLSAAQQWRNMLMLLPGIFCSVSLPMLAAVQEDRADFERTLEIAQSAAILAIVPAATIVLLVSRWIMGLYGKDFAGGTAAFVILLSGGAISGIGSVGGPAIQAKGKMWLGAVQNLTWGMVYVGFTLVWVRQWGGMALAVGFTLAYLVLSVWGYLYLYFRHLISRSTTMRFFESNRFVMAVAILALSVGAHDSPWLVLPLGALSVWLSLTVWAQPAVQSLRVGR